MNLSFTKMHGLGNDFIVVDTLTHHWKPSESWIRRVSDRKKGIGCDQLLLLEKCEQNGVDFIYRVFNANGQEVEMCGNGARCIGLYIQQHKLSTKTRWLLKTKNRIIRAEACEDGDFLVEMGQPSFLPQDVCFVTDQKGPWYRFNINEQIVEVAVVDVGNPHAVVLVNNFTDLNIQAIGKALQQLSCFTKGVNVHFARIATRGLVELQSFERGVGLTAACGSGACAAVAVGIAEKLLNNEVKVVQKGGNITVIWSHFEDSIYQKGPATHVYQGICHVT